MLSKLQQTRSLLRRLYHKRPFGSQHSAMAALRELRIHTNMYSQFSDVRFSSVAFAVQQLVTAWSPLGKKLTNGVVECILLRSEHSCYYLRVPNKGTNRKYKLRYEENQSM